MAGRRPISTGAAVAGLVATLGLAALAVRLPTVAPLLAAAAGWLGVETWLRHRIGTAGFRHSLHDRLLRSRAGYASWQRARLAQLSPSAPVQFTLAQLDADDGPIPALLPMRPHADLRAYAADELAAAHRPLRRRIATGSTVAAELLRANMVYPVLADVPAPKSRWPREIAGSFLAVGVVVAALAWLEVSWRIDPSAYHRTIPLALSLSLAAVAPLLEVVLATSRGRRLRLAAITLVPLAFMLCWTVRRSWDANWWQPAFGVREWLVVSTITVVSLGLALATSSPRNRHRLPPRRVAQLSWLSIASVAAAGLGLLVPVLAGPPPTPAFPHVSSCSLLSREALARLSPNIDRGPASTFTEATVNGCEWFQGRGPAPIEFVAIDAYVGSGDVAASTREFTLATHVVPGTRRDLPGPCDQAAEVVGERGVEVVLRCANLVLSVFSSAHDPGLAERLAAEAARVATAG
ncbi:hypothetical protein [Kutzneria sp. CA-103260]|uniref:hypothetical protein n=1 Tax=Kutzneria sp. CA-103260 TaxID=2802641 RepID=UPI001BA8E182|nr:hypothetical protein [Kutzneria sp. CA-103260]QUQ67621.1 hypothetical protein JJ691_53560 [Kutzneria sp. CA-103260]